MKIQLLLEKLKKIEEGNGNIEVVIDYDNIMGDTIRTTVENLFVEHYTFQGTDHPEKVVRLTL